MRRRMEDQQSTCDFVLLVPGLIDFAIERGLDSGQLGIAQGTQQAIYEAAMRNQQMNT